MKILVVDDEDLLVKGIKFNLRNDGYEVITGSNGLDAVRLAQEEKPDLIVLDIMMPEMDGLTACSRIREFSNIPIIFLTAKSDDMDKLIGFDHGTDDYLTKPFGLAELMARIRTRLRQTSPATPTPAYKALNLEIRFDMRRICLDGEEIHLTQVEYRLLTLLAENSGRVLTYDYLMNAIWGPYINDDNRILRVNMANIRRKIEKDPSHPQYVFTEAGIGYRMRENENA